MKRFVVIVIALMGLMSLVACGGGDDPQVAMCDALAIVDETAPQIAALGQVADLAQIVQLGASMDNAWRDVSAAVADMDDTALQTTFAPFDEAYTAIPAITQEMAVPIASTTLEAKNAIAQEAYGAIHPAYCE